MTTNIQSFAGDVKIDNGNLSVKSLEVKDNITKLASNNSSYSNVGILMTRKGGASNVALVFSEDGSNVLLGYTNDQGGDDQVDMLTSAQANLVVYGNVYVTGSFVGDGASLTGLVTDLQSVTEFGGSTDQTIRFTNDDTGIIVSSNALVSGNVTAEVYYGDGGLLSNITQTLEGITAIGNTTPYTIEFTNTDNSFVTSGNVGVSNTNPTADLCVGSNVVIDDTNLNKIDVVGNVACYQLNLGSVEILPAYSLENVTQISNTTTRTISFNNSTLAFDTQKMAGIGIIPSSADVGVSGLHVDGHLRLGGEAENTDEEQMYIKAAGALGVLANESDTNNTNTELRLQSGDTNNSNITMVGKSSAQYMTFGTNAAERMRINSSGSVGIGTNSPAYKLDVHGTSNVGALTVTSVSGDGSGLTSLNASNISSGTLDKDRLPTTLNNTTIEDAGSAFLTIHDSSEDNQSAVVYETTNYTWKTGIHGGDDGKFKISKDTFGGANDYLVIKTSGQVGIGTDGPGYTFDVVGTGGFSSNLTVGTANLHVDTTTGFVGVGTTKPDTKLHLEGDAPIIRFVESDTTVDAGQVIGGLEFYSRDASGDGYPNYELASIKCVNSDSPGASPDGDIVFSTGTHVDISEGERMRITAYGRVGVGTNIPAYKLDVAGDAYVSSNLTVGTANLHVDTTTGFVGVGTTNPTSNLHVVGDINLTSNIVMSGEVFVKAHDATKNYVAVGRGAGQSNQGTNAVAVGYLAGQTNQHDNTVVLNASGSALNTEGTGRTYIKPLRVATVASNVMTYDQTTGEVMDSGGLFTNRLAVVSEQPPSALTGDTTVVEGHGRYKVTTSLEAGSYQAWKCFNKSIDNADSGWSTGAVGAYNGDGTYAGSNVIAGVSGEWVKIEFPYKTTLRHVSLSPKVYYPAMPENFSIVASNDDSNWTVIKSVTGQAWTSADYVNFVVNAGVAYKYYAIVVQLTNTNYAYIGEWRLFTESFSVEGGIVTTTAASGLETGFTEHPVAPMTDYNTYVEGHGTYEASASSVSGILYPWQAFDRNTGTRFSTLATEGQYDETTGIFTTTVTTPKTIDVGGTRYNGHWLQLKTPYPIVLSHSDIFPTGNLLYRAPVDGVILGSNDGEAWYKLTEFSGKTYSDGVWTNIDVNATTPYQYFRMCITKIGTGELQYGITELEEWRLFSATGVTKMDNVLISGELAVDGGALQTSHIKWPKVPLKANESEGYVASASSSYNAGDYAAWHAFEDKGEYKNDISFPCWLSTTTPATFATGGEAQISRTTGDDTFEHEWLQIQLPQAIVLSYFYINESRYTSEAPKSGRMYGSNDGISFTKLATFSNKSGIVGRINVNATSAYKYYRLAITETQGSPDYVAINELQLFESTLGVGTSATTAKLTVDGGLGLAKGSQVFAGSDVITEFPKHDRPLTKYPEVAMTADSSGGYVANRSTVNNSGWEAWKMFNGIKYTSSDDGWHSALNKYLSATGEYDSTNKITDASGVDYEGEWTSIMMPKPVKLSYFKLYSRLNLTTEAYLNRLPKDGTLLGSQDGTTWYKIYSFTDRTYQFSNKDNYFYTNSTTYYKHFVLVYEKLGTGYGGTDNGDTVNIGEWELYGYEEGDESVDVVHRSIPNTPGQQQLAVYYEARDPNSYSFADSTKVYDLSGNGRTGTITGNNGFDAEYNAWVLDGSGDYISGTQGLGTGNIKYSVSLWFKADITSGNQRLMSFGAQGTAYQSSTLLIYENDIHLDHWLSEIKTTTDVITAGKWYHVVAIHSGTGTNNINENHIYLNGVKQTVETGGVSGNGTFNLQGNSLTLGADPNGNNPFDGSIANFRLYSKVLNADQVRELYEYDAERFGHRQNVVALHKGNLGVGVPNPTSRFEVAGADGVQEFPPKAMTANETYMEGHGVFRASDFLVFGAGYGDSGVLHYDPVDGTANVLHTTSTTTVDASIIYGWWFDLECPHKIKVETITLARRSGTLGSRSAFRRGYLLGSNTGNDGSWEIISTILTSLSEVGIHYPQNISSTKYYLHHRLICTIVGPIEERVIVQKWRLFGTPAPSSLEDGHLTLGKALTLPRVSGHPAGAETPRAESLVVHYDTTVDSVVSGSTVVDISGNGLNGTLGGTASYLSVDRALNFTGAYTSKVATANHGLGTGDVTFSVSFWFKREAVASTYDYLFLLGNGGVSKQSILFWIAGNKLYFDFWNGALRYDEQIQLNRWYHVVVGHTSGTAAPSVTNDFFYLDGERVTPTATGTSDTLNLQGNKLSLGSSHYSTTEFFNGSISNFKIWGGVALTPEEVAAEYALGRTGKSTNLTDTALCLGGTVPRAQLDVRGSTLVGGNVGIGTASPAYKLDVHGTSNVGALTATSATVPNDGDFVMGGKPLKPAVGLHWDRVNSRLEVNGLVGTSPTGGIIIPSGTTAQQPNGVTGMLRFNTTLGRLQVYNGTNWIVVGNISATGGTVTYADGYTIHTFTSSDTFTVYTSGDVEYLMVAGGGGGGGNHGGAGGAGGYISGSSSIAIGAYTITVGGGGAGGTSSDNGTNGSNSVFNSLIALGGGGGGHGYSNSQSNAGLSGGSGGGGAPFRAGGTTSDSAQGNNGGNGLSSGIAGHGGGGGGAGGAGGNALISGADDAGISGAGGIGLSSSITGTAVVRAGGGSGGRWGGTNTNPGAVGDVGTVQGGGGKGGAETNSGYVSVAGTANTGGGGGGGGDSVGPGAAGGSGIVIIRYLT
jgi:hypothetical protein